MDNYNYPMGADDSRAPWNREAEARDYEVEVDYTLVKNMTVSSYSGEDTDLKDGIRNAAHLSPLQLIAELKRRVEEDLKGDPGDRGKQRLLAECEGYTEDMVFWEI